MMRPPAKTTAIMIMGRIFKRGDSFIVDQSVSEATSNSQAIGFIDIQLFLLSNESN